MRHPTRSADRRIDGPAVGWSGLLDRRWVVDVMGRWRHLVVAQRRGHRPRRASQGGMGLWVEYLVNRSAHRLRQRPGQPRLTGCRHKCGQLVQGRLRPGTVAPAPHLHALRVRHRMGPREVSLAPGRRHRRTRHPAQAARRHMRIPGGPNSGPRNRRAQPRNRPACRSRRHPATFGPRPLRNRRAHRRRVLARCCRGLRGIWSRLRRRAQRRTRSGKAGRSPASRSTELDSRGRLCPAAAPPTAADRCRRR